MERITLPVGVQDGPHWRVILRPGSYQPERIKTLADCFTTIEKTKVSLRGWDYPHLSRQHNEREVRSTYVASWADFRGHQEYWRLYQSGQFIHLFSVREVTAEAWREQLLSHARNLLAHYRDVNWSLVPGCISLLNLMCTVTEIFEFASRLAQMGIYEGSVTIAVDIKGIQGFVLMAEEGRHWHNYYACLEDNLSYTREIPSDQLVADSAGHSFSAILWFFERFNWLQPPIDALRQEQRDYLQGRR